MVRLFKKKVDFGLVSPWWEARVGCPLPTSILSDQGYIANDVVACWLYLTNSDLAAVNWFISDPKSSTLKRSVSLRELVNRVSLISYKLGYKYLMCSLDTKKSSEVIEKAFDFSSAGREFLSFKKLGV